MNWPSRDPIEERGGINLYGFVNNDGVNQWDVLGRYSVGNIPGTSSGVPSYPDVSRIPHGDGSQIHFDTTATVESCNVIIFFGHNSTVPQGKIRNEPCSAASIHSCGANPDKDIDPATPEVPIPGAPKNTPDRKRKHIDKAAGEVEDAFNAGKKHARDLCKKGCCDRIQVRVECEFGVFRLLEKLWGEPVATTGGSICKLKAIIECN